MIKLYRAVSTDEKNDYDKHHTFQLGRNTLEAKQFFKSRTAVKQFVANSVERQYDPPYSFLLIISLDEELYVAANPTNMNLDGFEAVNISEDDLLSFNLSVNFVEEEEL